MKGRVVVGGVTAVFLGAILVAYMGAFSKNEIVRPDYNAKTAPSVAGNGKSDATSKDLKRQLAKSEDVRVEKESQITELMNKIDAVRDEKKALGVEISDLTKKVADLTAENTTLKGKLDQSSSPKEKIKKTFATIHYFRPDRDYYGWGLHTTGLAINRSTPWNEPVPFKFISEYGAYAKVELHDDHQKHPLEILVHRGSDIDCDPTPDKEGSVNSAKKALIIDASEQQEFWLVSGSNQVFRTVDDALGFMEQQ